MVSKLPTKIDTEQMKLELKTIFSERIISQTKFDRFMRERLKQCNPQFIADFMKLAGKKTGNVPVTKKHLSNIGG